MRFVSLKGSAIKPHIDEIASLRIQIFYEWPYIYDGDLKYEQNYLQTYADCEYSFIELAYENEKLVGASTAIWMPFADKEFQKPFLNKNMNPEEICYFGESILFSQYRGRGIGKQFMQARENFAKSFHGVKWASFCAVQRPETHNLKPKDYQPLDGFWQAQGFVKQNDMTALYSWKDRDQNNETVKTMQFWLKGIR